MANNRSQISYGSSGDDVKELQRLLNANGYNLSVDGVWGDNTESAVRKYQNQSGLTVDGIVGTQTWGSLYGGNKTTTPTTPTEPKSYSDIDLSKYDSGYQKSDDVINAETNKTNAENAVKNYGDFDYSNQSSLDEIMNKILNREQFSYDLNGDALYQQYKDRYTQQGKMAMQDTMGQAAALTGGYGNSYASTAGNQAYQAHLEGLNDVIPELYQMALDKYNQEGQDMLAKYSMLTDDRNMEYGMWGDKYEKLVADRDYTANEANNAYAKDYGEWSDSYNRDYNQYWQETNFGYGQERDAEADRQWQAQFDEAKRQYDASMAFQREQYEREMALEREKFEHQKSNKVVEKNDNTPNAPEDDGSQYASWGVGEWEGYFAQIRNSEGKAAAEEELNYFISQGWIPKNMITYASIGARGSLGH